MSTGTIDGSNDTPTRVSVRPWSKRETGSLNGDGIVRRIFGEVLLGYLAHSSPHHSFFFSVISSYIRVECGATPHPVRLSYTYVAWPLLGDHDEVDPFPQRTYPIMRTE